MQLKSVIIGLVFGGVIVGVAMTGGIGSVENITDDVLGESTAEATVVNSSEHDGMIQQIRFYSNGDAKVYLKNDHACYDTIEIRHIQSESVYKQVTAPEFRGPTTIDLRKILQKNGPYPNREFVITLTDGDQTEHCLAAGDTTHQFTAPAGWVETQ